MICSVLDLLFNAPHCALIFYTRIYNIDKNEVSSPHVKIYKRSPKIKKISHVYESTLYLESLVTRGIILVVACLLKTTDVSSRLVTDGSQKLKSRSREPDYPLWYHSPSAVWYSPCPIYRKKCLAIPVEKLW